LYEIPLNLLTKAPAKKGGLFADFPLSRGAREDPLPFSDFSDTLLTLVNLSDCSYFYFDEII
jgi:hypothetical protein